jgi:hypothetical protein
MAPSMLQVPYPILILALVCQWHPTTTMAAAQGTAVTTPAATAPYATTPSSWNATATTSSASTPAPPAATKSFCFTCGFDFGHIVDGIDDQTAGVLIVTAVLMFCCTVCFCLGCYCCGSRGNSATRYAPVKTGGAAENT